MPAMPTLATLGGLLWYCCATYWGPLLVRHPVAPATELAARSARLVTAVPLATGPFAGVAILRMESAPSAPG